MPFRQAQSLDVTGKDVGLAAPGPRGTTLAEAVEVQVLAFRERERQAVGVKNSDHSCDLRLRPIWPPVRSARIAFPEARVRTPPPTELAEI